MKKRQNPNMVPVVAILVIAGLEALAISQGIDGKVLTASIAAIAGIGGFKLRELFK